MNLCEYQLPDNSELLIDILPLLFNTSDTHNTAKLFKAISFKLDKNQ